MAPHKKKILIVCNVDWFFISHRLGIAKQAVLDGYDVYVAAEDTGRADEIRDIGAIFVNLSFSRSGTNIFQELKVIFLFNKLYNGIRPDIVHHITLKPVIYGSLIAKCLKVKGVVNAIAGLGYSFTGDRKGKGLLFSILIKLMRFGFKRKNLSVIFQNKSDFKDLKSTSVLYESNKIYFTKGSGVDLNQYKFSNLPFNKKINILFPTRMLWDKGVKELKKASEILKEKYGDKITFILAGLADDGNKMGVTSSYLKEWSDGEYVNWIGYQKDMLNVFADSEIVVLPSYYREGIPKSLIEACAIGRPIITTYSVGCEECVDDGVNGFKVEPRNAQMLADALEKLIVSRPLREEFGKNARIKAEKEFDIKEVIRTHMEIYRLS